MSTTRRLPVLCTLAALGLAAAASPATAAVRADEHHQGAQSAAKLTGPAHTRVTRIPPAGAPYYLHYGPTGLCSIGNGFDWSQVPSGDMVLFEGSRVLAIKGGFGAETLVAIETIDQGTTTVFDDELRVRVTVYSDGLDEKAEQTFPVWDTDGGGAIDGKATENTPQSLYLKRIELYASQGDRNAVVNTSRVPMHALGWFDEIETGQDGFVGGGGPDCVQGSLLNDEIEAGGGDDWVTAKDGLDVVVGGDGNDTIDAGSGEDFLEGNGGIDLLRGGNNNDCHQGGLDGQRDVYEDDGNFDFDSYVAEPGTVDGVEVPNIEYVVDEGALTAEGCI